MEDVLHWHPPQGSDRFSSELLTYSSQIFLGASKTFVFDGAETSPIGGVFTSTCEGPFEGVSDGWCHPSLPPLSLPTVFAFASRRPQLRACGGYFWRGPRLGGVVLHGPAHNWLGEPELVGDLLPGKALCPQSSHFLSVHQYAPTTQDFPLGSGSEMQHYER